MKKVHVNIYTKGLFEMLGILGILGMLNSFNKGVSVLRSLGSPGSRQGLLGTLREGVEIKKKKRFC